MGTANPCKCNQMPDADRPAPDAASGAAAVTLILVKNGTLKSHQKISDTEGGFTGILDDGDYFGSLAASLGDLDGDGDTDQADLGLLLAEWGCGT